MIELMGLVVGFLVGMVGIGGGALMTPLLILFGIPPKLAVGTDLVYAFSVKSFSALLHKKGRNFDYRLFKFTAIPGVFGVIVGHSFFAGGIINDKAIVTILALSLFTSSSLMLYSGRKRRIKTECFICEKYCESFHDNGLKSYLLIPTGFLVGLVVQITSVGGGALLTFAVLNLTNLKPNRVVGTDLATSTLLSAVAMFSHGFLGNVDVNLALRTIPPGLLGAIGGYCMSRKCSPDVLRKAIATSILLSSLVLILGKI